MKKIKITDITPKSIKGAELIERLLYIDEIDSTNSYLLRSSKICKSGTAVVTLNQTAGRGRKDHVWDSRGCAAVSVLFRGISSPLLPLAAATAAAEAIYKLSNSRAEIKWPNDILINEKKVCGILCEARASAAPGDAIAVCGAGFNLSQEQDFFEKAKLYHASSIYAQTGKILNYADIAEQFLLNLEENLKLIKNNASMLLQGYKDRCITIGRQVKIMPSEEIGTAVDIDADGALVVKTQSGKIKAYGDVSVRGVDGYI